MASQLCIRESLIDSEGSYMLTYRASIPELAAIDVRRARSF